MRTLVVRRGEDDYLFVLVPGMRALDWAKLRSHLGINRVSLPDADEATRSYHIEQMQRITAAYRDKYLDELGESADEDRFVEDHIQYDLSARYRVTPQFQVFAELVNLGDEPYVAYLTSAGRKRLLQYEEYSWTAKTGFRVSF